MSRGGRESSQTVRIVGGAWRGRRLAFPGAEGLRPTGDRIRETLFNWLQYRLGGARVLDLYAGSGALGFEALSRGAERAVFVERDRAVATTLRANLHMLGAHPRADVVCTDAARFLVGEPSSFDVVFLDPPFRSAIIESTFAELDGGRWLSRSAAVYLEFDRHLAPPPLPGGWSMTHAKAAGGVAYGLACRDGTK